METPGTKTAFFTRPLIWVILHSFYNRSIHTKTEKKHRFIIPGIFYQHTLINFFFFRDTVAADNFSRCFPENNNVICMWISVDKAKFLILQ